MALGAPRNPPNYGHPDLRRDFVPMAADALIADSSQLSIKRQDVIYPTMQLFHHSLDATQITEPLFPRRPGEYSVPGTDRPQSRTKIE